MRIVPWDPFFMKKLLKNKIYGSVNSAHCALFTKKVKYFSKKKRKERRRRNVKCAFGKRANALLSIVTLVC